MAYWLKYLHPPIKCDSSAICESGGRFEATPYGLIVKGKRISCPPHYAPPNNDYDPPRHDYEHGFPLIRSLRASAQRSASILVSSRRRLDQRAVRCKSRRNRRGAGFQSQGVGDQKRVLRDPNVGLDCC